MSKDLLVDRELQAIARDAEAGGVFPALRVVAGGQMCIGVPGQWSSLVEAMKAGIAEENYNRRRPRKDETAAVLAESLADAERVIAAIAPQADDAASPSALTLLKVQWWPLGGGDGLETRPRTDPGRAERCVRCEDRAPDHWRTAGPRSSPVGDGKPRRAINPVHAMLNYAYGILATETTIAARELGLDPNVGLMHLTRRLESDLISDLKEPGRPVAERLVVDYLESHALGCGDLYETPDGRCRLGPEIIEYLASGSARLYEAVKDPAFEALGTILAAEGHRAPVKLRRLRKKAG